MEECRGRWVNGAGKKHETFGEDISSKAQDSVTVDASVLKVDSRSAIGGDDDLELGANENP